MIKRFESGSHVGHTIHQRFASSTDGFSSGHIWNSHGDDYTFSSNFESVNFFHSHAKKQWFKWNFTVTTAQTINISLYCASHGSNQYWFGTVIGQVFPVGSYTYYAYFDLSEPDSPTYFEQLHKLDGNSKAQYIPSRK